jgi:hypothetical protein
VTASIGRVPETRIAIRALTRTFLRRFFDNEITGGTQDLTVSFFWLIGFLAAPLTLMPVGAMMRYRLIVLTHGADALRILSRTDKVVTIILGMMAAAMISAIVWSSLMLERRDGLILGALPVRGRTVVVSKLAALAIYIFGISVAIHAVSSVLYGIALADHAPTWRLIFMGPIAHFAATVSSCVFVFLSVTAVQGLALALTGPAGFRRISSVLQVVLVASIVVGFTEVGRVVQGVAQLNQLSQPSPPAHWLLLMPPVWFLGLYEWLLGGADPVYGSLAVTAVLAFLGVAAVTVVTYIAAYRRVMVRTVETPAERAGAWRVSAAADWITRRISRTPARRASMQFFVTAIGRVERLRFVVAVTIGILCAWLVPAVVTIATPGQPPASPRTTFALSYAALALVLVGLRITVSMPADLRASWMIPMIDARGAVLRSGVWRALYLTSVAPVVVGFALFNGWLWDWRVAALHAGVMAAIGALLVELSLWHFDGLPNNRPWRPEHANLRFWWPAYLYGFITLTRTVPNVELSAGDPLAAGAILAGTAMAAAAILRVFHRRPHPLPSFEIETVVESAQVLHLD